MLKKKFGINSVLYTNIIFGFFPISFIFGNLVTNFNLLLFCCFGIYQLKSKILTTKFNFILKIIFSLFLVIFFSTLLSFIKSLYFDDYNQLDLIRLTKSIIFFRYFILLLIIYILSDQNIINFKYFFISAAFVSIFISIDVSIQYFFGYNMVGIKSLVHHNSSFFTDELISGGFIQNFSFFSIIFLSYITRNNNNYLKIILISIVISFLGIGIMVSGNRMPFLLFLFGLIFIYIFNKELRKIFLISYAILFISLGSIISSDERLRSIFVSLSQQPKGIVTAMYDKIVLSEQELLFKERNELLSAGFDRQEAQGHKKLFATGIETWKLHKIFGNGIKSFREDCKTIVLEQKRGICSNHPHNFYIEILSDLGLVGFFNVMVIALIFIFFLLKNFRILKGESLGKSFLQAATISLILGVFPLRSTGSIFTTNVTTYIILISAIILSYKKLSEGKNFE